ncbi:hypothetical protein [Marinilabilia salmonicolor]|uniref:hypothetical protein n=1 Tax=Marinilabilia salmonicolor TaxID=989 RepID=UPI00029A51EE|nr:hypothetical protein [Marinilabilia salmonicolor]
MNNSTILRTSAILFAEDSENINPVIIKRKMIEGIFLELDNRKLKIFEIVDFLKSMLDLAFTEEEIVGIINESSEGFFDIIPSTEHSKSIVQLTSDRFKKLQKKVEELSFDDIIELFGQDIYEGSIEKGDIRDVVYRYIYYLINTNHRTLSKIISGKKIDGEISLIEAKFKSSESDLINQFINWDNKAKDKSLYMLISYSIEYCLIVNNADSESFAESIKDKVFFLDTNILFRALGINGETREKRIISFLEKCRDNGQEFAISKYTLTEFNDTINYHLKRINELPYAKINPEIFEYFNLNSSIAKSFYTWKAGRSMEALIISKCTLMAY